MSGLLGQETLLGLTMRFSMAGHAEGDQIFGCVIAQSASRLNVMDLNILQSPARLTTPPISLQNFTAKLAINFVDQAFGVAVCRKFESERHLDVLKELPNLRLR
jgi:hypothetical protein